MEAFMKNLLRFAALLIFASVILTSCGGLLSTRDAGRISFTVDPAMLNSARSAGFDLSEQDCTFYAHVYSEQPGLYDRNDSFNVAQGTATNLGAHTFSFDGIPLHTPMKLKVEILSPKEVNGALTPVSIFSNYKDFTLSKPGETPVELVIFPETAINWALTKVEAEGSITKIASFPVFTDGNLNPGELESLSNQLLHPNAYCYDYQGNIWYIGTFDYLGTMYTNLYNCDDDSVASPYQALAGSITLQSVVYDRMTGKICVIAKTAANEWYVDQFPCNPANSISNYSCDSVADGIKLKATPFSTDASKSYTDTAPIAYAYGGYLYTLRTFDHSIGNPEISLCKFSLSDGSLVATKQVQIPHDGYTPVNARTDATAFEFNDMAVYEDELYILIHHREYWDNCAQDGGGHTHSPSPKANQYEMPDSLGCIDRGGILVFDTDTLASKGTLGMPEVKSSLTMPVYVRDNGLFFPASDASKNPITVTFPITWAMADPGELNFSNPRKIVAIMPKKLIVADGGAFFYSNINGKIGNEHPSLFTNNSRAIAVDLEDFSKSEILGRMRELEEPWNDWYSATGLNGTTFSLAYTPDYTGQTVYHAEAHRDPVNQCEFIIDDPFGSSCVIDPATYTTLFTEFTFKYSK